MQESVTKIAVGLVGYGYWGPNLLRNIVAHGGFDVVGVVDSSEDARRTCRRNFPTIEVYASLDELFAAKNPTAMVVATPPKSHRDVAMRCLAQGAHVLLEKPLAPSLVQSEEILDEARRRGLMVMVDHTFLYHPAVDFIVRSSNEGLFGQLLYYDSVRVNFGGFQSGVDVLWDLAPHDLSIIDRILGGALPVAVSALGMRLSGSEVDSVCYLTLQYPNGFMAHLHLSWIAPVKLRTILLGGTKKMVLYDDNLPAEKVKIYDKRLILPGDMAPSSAPMRVEYRVGDMVAPALSGREALNGIIAAFHESLAKGTPPLSDGEAGKRVVQILEHASESLRRAGERIQLPNEQQKSIRRRAA